VCRKYQTQRSPVFISVLSALDYQKPRFAPPRLFEALVVFHLYLLLSRSPCFSFICRRLPLSGGLTGVVESAGR